VRLPPDSRSSAAHGPGAVVRRAGLPLLILDLAVPRAVEAATRDVPGVQVVDMNDLSISALSRACNAP